MTPGFVGRWQAFAVVALLCLSACTAAIPEPGLRGGGRQNQASNLPPPDAPATYGMGPSGSIQSGPLGQAYARPGDDLLGGPPIPPPPADFSTAPPPPAYAYAPPPAAAYAPGGAYAPPPPAIVYVPAPAYAPPPMVISSPPVPNPEDMSPEERLRVYGPPKIAARAAVSPARTSRSARAAPRPSRQAPARPSVQAVRPPTPTVSTPVKPAPQASASVPMPAKVAAPPPSAPAAASAAPSPSVAVKPAPAQPSAPPSPAPVKPATPADKLGQAMAGPVSTGASLVQVAPAVADQPHTVTLALPSDLLSVLRREAAKLGLGRKARSADVVATLSGQNYEITPNGPQTLHLQPGQTPSFTWAVRPLKGATGALSAKIEALLKGQGSPAPLSLGQIDRRFSDLADKAAVRAKGAASGLSVLNLPNMAPIELPGVGKVQSGVVVASLIVFFLLVLIIAMIRASNERRLQREPLRRRGAMSQFKTDPPPTSEMREVKEIRTVEKV